MLDGGQGVQGRGVIKGRKHWEKCNGIVKKIYLKNKQKKSFEINRIIIRSSETETDRCAEGVCFRFISRVVTVRVMGGDKSLERDTRNEKRSQSNTHISDLPESRSLGQARG